MRSIKFDQLGKKAPVGPPSALAAPSPLAKGTRSFAAEAGADAERPPPAKTDAEVTAGSTKP
jgi:hypothetical protein